MANTIKIKRSTTTVTPTSLSEGELAYSEASNNLFIGTSGSNVANIGGVIGTTVQAYDVDTAKYDDVTANFTGTLQNGGSNVIVDTDIGSTVQAYDVNIVTDGSYQSTANDFTNILKSKLDGVELLADVTDTINVTAAGALMDSELAGLAAVKATTGTFLTADQTKLDGIETSADVTDTANVVASLTAGTNVAISLGGTVSSIDTTYTVGDGGLTQNNLTNALKSNYDSVYTWFTTMTTADGDSIINTVNEIVSAFESHSEGLNLITELDAKLTAASTIDGGTF
jgi:hypothetical protein